MKKERADYYSPTVVSLGTLASSTRAIKEQPPADALGLTQTGSTPGEDVPPENGGS